MRLNVVVASMVFCLLGCSAIDKVSDQDLADNIKMGAKAASEHGLKYAINKNLDKKLEIEENAKLAVKVIRTTILPMFQGASTGDVLRKTVDLALADLSTNLTPMVMSAIQLSVNIIATEVTLPENPASKLDGRTRLALVGLFEGTAEGLEKAIAVAVAEKAGVGLRWPSK